MLWKRCCNIKLLAGYILVSLLCYQELLLGAIYLCMWTWPLCWDCLNNRCIIRGIIVKIMLFCLLMAFNVTPSILTSSRCDNGADLQPLWVAFTSQWEGIPDATHTWNIEWKSHHNNKHLVMLFIRTETQREQVQVSVVYTCLREWDGSWRSVTAPAWSFQLPQRKVCKPMHPCVRGAWSVSVVRVRGP